MAKRKNKNKKNFQRANVSFHPRNRVLKIQRQKTFKTPFRPYSLKIPKRPTTNLKKRDKNLYHDRRLSKPSNLRRFLLYGPKDQISGTTLRNRTKSGKPYSSAPRQRFVNVQRQEICKRRSRRRRYLFSFNMVGKGIAIKTKKTLNWISKIGC